MKAAIVLLNVCLTLPIWFYLLYKILEAVNASDLMWFLYWVYIPATILINLLIKLIRED